MRRLAVPLGALVLGVAVVQGQGPNLAVQVERPSGPRAGGTESLQWVFTRPALPPREALARLNLVLAWRTYLPVESRRDGLFTVQHFGRDILVQTRSGLVVSLDPADGSTRWRAAVGDPYKVNYPLTCNRQSVFAVRGVSIIALDRDTGRAQWNYALATAPVAPPAADEEHLYICEQTGLVSTYELPLLHPPSANAPPPREMSATDVAGRSLSAPQPPGGLETRTAPAGPPSEAPQPGAPSNVPRLIFDLTLESRLRYTPLLSANLAVAVGDDGVVTGIVQDRRQIQYQTRLDYPPSAPPAQHQPIIRGVARNFMYLPSQGFDVYAVDLPTGQLVWRFTGSALIRRRPLATDDAVYLTPDWSGLLQIRPDTGELMWRNQQAYHFLSANPKFVYALDRHGRLMVLDRSNGTALGGLDTRDYVVPISNELTDRVFLGANDGLLVCLHDADYPTPQVMNKQGMLRGTPAPARGAPSAGKQEGTIPAPSAAPDRRTRPAKEPPPPEP